MESCCFPTFVSFIVSFYRYFVQDLGTVLFLDSKHNTKGNGNSVEQSSSSEVNMKVLKCAGKRWRRSVEPVVWELKSVT